MESCSACTHSLSLPLKHNKLHTKPLYGVFHVTWIWYQSRECFPLSISIQPLLLLTKERQEHEKYLEYTHTHNRRLLPLKIYSSRPIWKNNLMQQIFLPGLTLPWIWCEINIYLPFQKPSLSLTEPSHSSSNSSKILNYLNQKHIQFAKTVWGLTFYFANQMFKEVHTFLSGLHQ